MSENALFQNCLRSPQVDCKPYSFINLLMVMWQKAPLLSFEAFPRWKYQPGVWQNDGALRGSITRTSPGPLCAEDEFWQQSSLLWHQQPSQLRWKVPAAYLWLPGCVLSSFFYWTVSCCFRAREHGGVCAGEMPLAGYCVVDAFGYDVRAFVLKLSGAL